jgi:hypothetical protein
MRTILRVSPSMAALLALAAAGCASTPQKATAPNPAAPGAAAALAPWPAIALRPAGEARARLGMSGALAVPTAVAADLDRLARSIDLPVALGELALAKLIQIPMQGVRLSREQWDRLDPARPVGAAGLMGAEPGAGPGGVCVALTFRDVGLARKTLAEVGTETGRAGGVASLKLASGSTVAVALHGRTLLLASDAETLLAAGALAEEVQLRPRAGQAVVSLHPQVLARAYGASMADLVARAAESMARDMAGKSSKPGKSGKGGKGGKGAKEEVTPAMQRTIVAGFRAMGQLVAESQVVRLVVSLGAADGLLLRTELEPLPGTPFAARAATAHPYALDRALVLDDDRTTVMAFGDMAATVPVFEPVLRASGPAGRTLAREATRLSQQVTAGGSCAMVFSAIPMAMTCAMELRPGVTPRTALDSYTAVVTGMNAWTTEAVGRRTSKIKVKRRRDAVEIEDILVDRDPVVRSARRALVGGDALRYVVTVRDGRLVVQVGEAPPARKPGPNATPILTATLTRTAGAEMLAYVDVLAFLAAYGKNAQDPGGRQLGVMLAAVPGLIDLSAPMVFTMRGGPTPSFDFQLPQLALANIARVLKPFMGTMGGGRR